MGVIPAQEFEGVDIPEISFATGVQFMKGTYLERPYYDWFDTGVYVCIFSDYWSIAACAWPEAHCYYSQKGYGGEDASANYPLEQIYTHDGKTVYYHMSGNKSPDLDFSTISPSSCYNDFPVTTAPSFHYIAWLMIYGGYNSTTVSIPVQWFTDYQTEAYEDTFDITVTQ